MRAEDAEVRRCMEGAQVSRTRDADLSVRTVLLVEDEFLIAVAMAQALTGVGWEVTGPVASGEEAVEVAFDLRPDAIIMDVRLKGAFSGLQAAEAIRERLPTPIVFCTAFTDPATRRKAEMLGAPLLNKPAHPEALLTALAAVIPAEGMAATQ